MSGSADRSSGDRSSGESSSGESSSGEWALTRRILHNDLRLFWRGAANKKAAWLSSTLGKVAMIAFLHLALFGMLAAFGDQDIVGGPEAVTLFVGCLLAMAALHRTIEVLYNRGDLPLLLASPVPAHVVLRTRLVDLTLTTLLSTLALVLPLVDVAVILFGWHWAWGYVAWLAMAALVVPVAVLTTLFAVERIGVRRARTAVQMLGILVGMGAVVLQQLPSLLATSSSRGERMQQRSLFRADVYAWFDVPPLRQLAAAAAGEWHTLVPLAVGGVALFFVAQRQLAARFASGAQAAVGDLGGGKRQAPGTPVAWQTLFVRPRWRVLLRTQMLLLRRDPLLIMRVAMQTITLVPMLFGALMVHRGVGIAGFAILAAAMVPLPLAALLNGNDEAHEFVGTSPLTPRERAVHRTVAVAVPFVVLAAALAVVVGNMLGIIAALMTAFAGCLLAFATAWLGTCTTQPFTAEERARNRPLRIGWQTFAVMALAGATTAGIGTTAMQHPLVGILVYAAGLLCACLLFLVRPRATRYST